ncbi:MAG TPA: exodeoxyribonuclease VII large subunit [Candidatus Krumholzibacteria bacterium]|nr:exodeoxyribonuclease VII large subunit [Candidatus Krumholzibacteria bacterium]
MSFAEERIFAVGEINTLVREMLEGEFPAVAIAGEVSNLRVPASGHIYFKLKDAAAQIAAVCFRSDARRLDFDLEDGAQVIARGTLTLYDAQGSYQLIARSLEPAGRGDLERALRLLIARLREEGLFDAARKRPLPRYPNRVAVVTSSSGAAVRDILSTIQRRFPCVEVLIAPVQVQGDAAPAQIIRALDMLSARGDVDVVILGRGGGSIEDLSAFNHEGVARAIHRCAVPVVSAVGHETDVTIADFVADVRAATPTMAAEIAVPARAEVLARIAALERTAGARLAGRVDSARRRTETLTKSYALGRVRGRIEHAMQRLDHAAHRCAGAGAAAVVRASAQTVAVSGRLASLNPRDVLRRGYAVVVDPARGVTLTRAVDAVRAGDVQLVFNDGAAHARVSGEVATEAAPVREVSK